MREPTTPHAEAAARAIRDIDAAIAASDYQRAAVLADAASAQGLVHPVIPIARALSCERLGRDEAAVACFHEARTLSPRDARIPNAIGYCLIRLGRIDEALAAFEEAIRLEPSAAAYQRKGWALGMAGRAEESERAYERALKLAPNNLETLASLAWLSARKGNMERARKYGERALALNSRNANAHAAVATVEIAEGAYKPAIERLKSVLENSPMAAHERSPIFALLGDAYDAANATREAFAAYTAANDERRKLYGGRFADGKNARRILDELIAAFAQSPAAHWRVPEPAATEDGGPSRHVFLLGFPRSGTTLLEQALEGNPAIATLDERDFLADMAEQYLGSAAGLETLSQLNEAALARHREAYWQRVHATGLKPAGRVFVDKNPFHTIKLPLIARLFPGARVLFGIRDPRDVVLSCFRRQLSLDRVRFEFLTLEGAAEMYDRFMAFAELCRTKLPLAFFDQRYEDLVADFDTATRGVCAWLGVPWAQSMRDVAANAQRLATNKVSTMQVRRGLYEEGAGHWRRYSDQLDPVLPVLQPWIARFRYPDK